MLEEGDYYFQDAQCSYFDATANRLIPGRLKICARCLIFEPTSDFLSKPLLKFNYLETRDIREDTDLNTIRKVTGNEEKTLIRLDCAVVVEMKANNINYPFFHRSLPPNASVQYLVPEYVPVSRLLPLITTLHSLAQPDAVGSEARVEALVAQCEAKAPFDTLWLDGLSEHILAQFRVSEHALHLHSLPARLVLTNLHVFISFFANTEARPFLRIPLADLIKVVRRRYAMREIGLELFFTTYPRPDSLPFFIPTHPQHTLPSSSSFYLSFSSSAQRNSAFRIIFSAFSSLYLGKLNNPNMPNPTSSPYRVSSVSTLHPSSRTPSSPFNPSAGQLADSRASFPPSSYSSSHIPRPTPSPPLSGSPPPVSSSSSILPYILLPPTPPHMIMWSEMEKKREITPWDSRSSSPASFSGSVPPSGKSASPPALSSSSPLATSQSSLLPSPLPSVVPQSCEAPSQLSPLYQPSQHPLSLVLLPPPALVLSLWLSHRISNLDYLLYLNCLADRSFNDPSQYPVVPWVLNERGWKSEKIRLEWTEEEEEQEEIRVERQRARRERRRMEKQQRKAHQQTQTPSISPHPPSSPSSTVASPTEINQDFDSDDDLAQQASSIFRDLSRPIGALNRERFAKFKERARQMRDVVAQEKKEVKKEWEEQEARRRNEQFRKEEGMNLKSPRPNMEQATSLYFQLSGSSTKGSDSDSIDKRKRQTRGSKGSRDETHPQPQFASLSLPSPHTDRQIHPHPSLFFFGTHYSTPSYLIFFLFRILPQHLLRLQDSRFEQTSRLFVDIAKTWEGVMNNPADLKELIPEFYLTPSFLHFDPRSLDLSSLPDGHLVGDITLPPFAHNSQWEDKSDKPGSDSQELENGSDQQSVWIPSQPLSPSASPSTRFIHIMRCLLESPYVSFHLSDWIDLVFGVSQRGKASEEAENVFYWLTYEENVKEMRRRNWVTDMSAESDDESDFGSIQISPTAPQSPQTPSSSTSSKTKTKTPEILDDWIRPVCMSASTLNMQINEFGQCPRQLLTTPHPRRSRRNGKMEWREVRRMRASVDGEEHGERVANSPTPEALDADNLSAGLPSTLDSVSFIPHPSSTLNRNDVSASPTPILSSFDEDPFVNPTYLHPLAVDTVWTPAALRFTLDGIVSEEEERLEQVRMKEERRREKEELKLASLPPTPSEMDKQNTPVRRQTDQFDDGRKRTPNREPPINAPSTGTKIRRFFSGLFSSGAEGKKEEGRKYGVREDEAKEGVERREEGKGGYGQAGGRGRESGKEGGKWGSEVTDDGVMIGLTWGTRRGSDLKREREREKEREREREEKRKEEQKSIGMDGQGNGERKSEQENTGFIPLLNSESFYGSGMSGGGSEEWWNS
ncbi:putative FAN protein [Blattamonas nauphoetae]|uniref:FAN protein n=1 Tax=Blattamonas nauphoetae TaxID=2049346 RepID=A0ABQ9XUE5_9EUKA|nr:putative FAN protein [Blattamonas nauphoetae]